MTTLNMGFKKQLINTQNYRLNSFLLPSLLKRELSEAILTWLLNVLGSLRFISGGKELGIIGLTCFPVFEGSSSLEILR